MARPNRYSPEVRELSVRIVLECVAEYSSQWAALNRGYPHLLPLVGTA